MRKSILLAHSDITRMPTERDDLGERQMHIAIEIKNRVTFNENYVFFVCFTINVAQFTVTAGSVTRISTTIPFSFVAYYQHRKFATSGSTDPMRLVP